MSEGGCCCGATRIKFTGEPQVKALCHCEDCKRITGSAFSTNIVVPGEGFSVIKGTPKEYTKKADGGNSITSHFCGECGSTLFRSGQTFGDSKVVKVGVMDDTNALVSAEMIVL